jgi:hypothetical protein
LVEWYFNYYPETKSVTDGHEDPYIYRDVMLELKINNIFFFYIFMEIKKNIFFAWWTLKCANTKLIIFPYQSLLTKFGYFFKTDQNWFDRNYCVLWNFIININIVWKFYLMNRIIHEKLLTSTVFLNKTKMLRVYNKLCAFKQWLGWFRKLIG